MEEVLLSVITYHLQPLLRRVHKHPAHEIWDIHLIIQAGQHLHGKILYTPPSQQGKKGMLAMTQNDEISPICSTLIKV